MKKLFLLFFIFIILVFIVPIIFTRSFLSTTINEPDNIVNIINIAHQEEKLEDYNYKDYDVIKLLHKNENVVEEMRIR